MFLLHFYKRNLKKIMRNRHFFNVFQLSTMVDFIWFLFISNDNSCLFSWLFLSFLIDQFSSSLMFVLIFILSLTTLLQNSKRNKVCRPKSLLQKNLSSASSWSSYRNMRRNAPYLRYFHTSVMSWIVFFRTTRQPTEVNSIVDYEVYLVNQYSYHTSTLFKPLFNLVCHE